MSTKTIQLTDRKKAFWKSKNKETGAVTRTQMCDMEDKSLQAILIVTQKRKLLDLESFLKNCKLEEQILQAAKERGAVLKDLDYEKSTWIANKFGQFKKVMELAYKSISKNIKKEKQETEEQNKEVLKHYEQSSTEIIR